MDPAAGSTAIDLTPAWSPGLRYNMEVYPQPVIAEQMQCGGMLLTSGESPLRARDCLESLPDGEGSKSRCAAQQVGS